MRKLFLALALFIALVAPDRCQDGKVDGVPSGAPAVAQIQLVTPI